MALPQHFWYKQTGIHMAYGKYIPYALIYHRYYIFLSFSPQIITGNVKVVIYAGRGGRGVKFQVHTINGWR